MADLVGCVKEIGNCILTQCIQLPDKSHFDYWWCFDDNIQGLKDGIRDLERQKHYIEQESEEARLRTDILCPGVEEWLKSSTEKLEEAQKILLPDHNIPKAWNLISRYSLGKTAKKTAQEIENFRNEGNFNPIADPAPPAAMGSPFHRPTVEFESRKSIEKDIVDCLKKRTVGMIGICGMGGVGKTTMAERIRERVKEEDLFDEVVMVTVTQTIDMLKIQSEIAEWLKLKFDEKHISTRAAKLRTRLMDTKRKIIIFDDVWDPSLKFEELGIPIESNFERCKVVLTSRSRDTCKRFKNKVVFDLKILEEEESWILFKENAGKCVENSDLHCLAKEVVKECKGLPIALVVVGIALQDETNICKWRHSLSQLKRSNPKDFSEVLTYVYKPLKLSYDNLENDRLRNLFLMCCLFPEDYDISIEKLAWDSMGLRLFDDITNIEEARDDITSIEEARNQTHTLVEKLKSRYLLIAGKDKLHVRIHDVLRDVAIYIGSIEKDGFLKSLNSIQNVKCNWMSVDISNEQMEVPVLSRFPKLRLLMLLKLSSNQFSDISFEGMEGINVLSFESISIRSLPPTLGSLENLQTLHLFRCEVENISVIGKLTSLKILICSTCSNITELPAEIGRLKGLRLLELNGCYNLQKIPFGILSSLFLLEELKIRFSFCEWETGGETRNASLTELERLPNLTCLEIQISDCTLSAKKICLSQKLVRYTICIGDADYDCSEDRDYEKVMILNLSGAVGNWIQLLARNAESLRLQGDGSDNINLAEMENLRSLSFTYCSTVKKLVDISYPNQNVSLCNLKSIYIERCSNLKHVFSMSVDRTRLLQLEFLRIKGCPAIEQVFSNEDKADNTYGCIEFPNLKELKLENLPNLTAFCQGLENIIIKFPNLIQMKIDGLPKMNNLFSPNSETVENTCFHLFCNPKDVSFCNLKSIYISRCYNLRYLFSVSAARRCLLQLEVLDIAFCDSMEQVFWNEGTDDNTDGCIEFLKLKEVALWNLENLTTFCRGLENIIIKFPNLTQMSIKGLPKLSSLATLNSKTVENTCFHLFPKDLSQLEILSIEDCESMEQVFWHEIKDNNTYGCIEFPKLKELTLVNLPNLIAFCQGLENIITKFPNLTKMKIRPLPKLSCPSPLNSETVGRHDENSCFHFVCNPKVEMDLLKNLELSIFECNVKNIWCHQIPNNFFNNLEELHIYRINGIRSLMSSSIAKNLTSLKYLCINDCKEMVEVIEVDDDNDKQVVDINRLFPNLRQLLLWYLDKLTRFWQWNHALELPLLEKINIRDCKAMETFTFGFVNTPNIREIFVNNEYIPDNKDLNDFIRHMWTKSTFKTEEDRMRMQTETTIFDAGLAGLRERGREQSTILFDAGGVVKSITYFR